MEVAFICSKMERFCFSFVVISQSALTNHVAGPTGFV